jgi:hypothetical protein
LAIPFLIALGELVVVVVLLVAGVVGRVVFRRPWIVDAVDPAGAHHKWPVVGRRASGVARRFIADRVAATGHRANARGGTRGDHGGLVRRTLE